eukprot:TRINITY_DN2277_c0_g1_i1.p1 TRINITY_DN2277_c0_g1~~TRINITY_DN2277_c0_g1_i1.p1  ORF type:complete len:1277 (+),score=324.69 TRINITY_DN2277_c0_g1_i1:241-3831(+)
MKPSPSLTSVVIGHNKGLIIISIFLNLLQLFWQMVVPLLLPFFISYLAKDSTEENWWGWIYISVVVGSSIINSVMQNHMMLMLNQSALRIMSGLQLLIYDKVLKIPLAGENSGKIVSLMTSDTEIIGRNMPTIIFSISAPIQVAAILYLLYQQIEYLCFVPVGVIVLVIPITGVFGIKVYQYFEESQKSRDARIKAVNELTYAIRIVKFYAWEKAFEEKISKLREVELDALRSVYLWATAMYGLLSIAPDLATAVTFVLYGIINPIPDISVLFTSLNLLDQLRLAFFVLPTSFTQVAQFLVTIRRIADFLLKPELERTSPEAGPPKMEIIGGKFRWNEEAEACVLQDINLCVEGNDLTMVVGAVGAGKSSLAYAFLGELPQIEGERKNSGEVCLVSQSAWILNATIRDNILFGLPYRHEFYQRVIKVSALVPDLEMMQHGDLTEIGERGINLSGGQKQRIAIARALYSNRDCYIFDDPLSAVDSHVGRHIFDQAIAEFLKDKPVLFITNQLQYLPEATNIVYLEGGKIEGQGNFRDLSDNHEKFAELMKDHGVFEDDTKENKTSVEKVEETTEEKKDEGKDTFITDEEAEIGQVEWEVYKFYMKSGGLLVVVSCVFLFFQQGGLVAGTWWLQYWPQSAAGPNPHPSHFYLAIYSSLNVTASISLLVFFATFLLWGVRASDKLHKECLAGMIRSPTSFFDRTPIGRILARFSTDMTIVDVQLVFAGFAAVQSFASMVGVVTWMCIGAPFILIALPFFGYIYFKVQAYYRNTSIQMQRLESLSRAPLYSHFSETLQGVATIRAWHAEKRFLEENLTLIDKHNCDWYALKYASSWFGLFLYHIGNGMQAICFICIVCLRIYLRDSDFYDAGLMVATVSITPQLVWQLKQFAQNLTMTETQMNSVERIRQFVELPAEAPEISRFIEMPRKYKDVLHIPKDWPSGGKIEFKNVEMRYREDRPIVLKGISVSFNAREKIGIVGRTGSGKSTLMQVLFRMVELTSGNIYIDDVDIATLGLKELRSNLAIIPQEPTMFTGTVRYNVDPFNEYSDGEIWEALELSSLKKYITSLPNQLEDEVTENGANFSVGQRQLMCMARALLKNPKILLMDEATASVDMETDKVIQETIRKSFANATLLVIAHRINTIIDMDRILVLSDGKVVEFDTPRALLSNPDGVFTKMVKATGDSSAAFLKRIALKEDL